MFHDSGSVGKLPDRMHTLPEVLRNVLLLLESIQFTNTPVAKCLEQYIVMFSTLIPLLSNLDILIRQVAIFLFVITWSYFT